MKLLSRAEEIVLLTILKLDEHAYGVAIRDHLKEETGTDWSFGSIYMPLNRLTKKGYVTKHYADPIPERGGRRKCIYAVTDRGIAALKDLQKIHESVWSGIKEVFLKQEN
ncbi:MAG: helix-turn-helix transcriptional regulator [Candidatus Aminicenantes bacterium]|jgi:DNA-binding PadR family transcriptional regulator